LIRKSLADVRGRNDSPEQPPRKEQRPAGSGAGAPSGRPAPPSSSRGGDAPRPSGGGSSSGAPSGPPPGVAVGRKRIPPAETNAEIFYYKKQMDAHTPMVFVLQDGEEIEGTIEWYDRNALKVNREGEPNIMLLKHNIKYMYKAEDRADEGEEEDDD
jgi:sRNA-binding regulator protein Hfq